jgi:hypothetical protein
MKHIKLYEEFINEALDLNSEEFREYVKDMVSKKCPWAVVTSETTLEKNGSDGIKFDYAVEIYWREGEDNDTSSMIGVASKGKSQKIGLDPNNPDRPKFGSEIEKTTAWNKKENAIALLLKTLKSNSSNSPSNN